MRRCIELAPREFDEGLRGGLRFELGAFSVGVASTLLDFGRVLQRVYGAFPFQLANTDFCDIRLRVARGAGPRRFFQPQSRLFCDGEYGFEPFPLDTAFPMFEWGTNWYLGHRSHAYLMLHAGVVAKDDRAVILAALPGSGKSTLTAALSLSGYRLLSDEFGVVRFSDQVLLPLLKPPALKNQSIAMLRARWPGAVLGPVFPKTRKGDVAHLAPGQASVDARHRPARAVVVIFPRYVCGMALECAEIPPEDAFFRLAYNSFNYGLMGPDGFNAVGALLEQCRCYTLEYGDIDAAIAEVGDILAEAG